MPAAAHGAAPGRLLQPVSEPLDRDPRLRQPAPALRGRRRWCELQRRRLRPAHRRDQPGAAESVCRPGRPGGLPPQPAKRRGWSAALPGLPDHRRPARVSAGRSSASTRTPAPASPATPSTTRSIPTRTRAGCSPTGCATPTASRSRRMTAGSGSATPAGRRRRRSTRSRTSSSAGPELRLAVLRGRRATAGVRPAEPHPLREPLRRWPERGSEPDVRLRPPRRALPGRPVPGAGRRLRELRDHVLHGQTASRPNTTARCSSPTTRAIASGASRSTRTGAGLQPDGGLRPEPGRAGRSQDRTRRSPLLRRHRPWRDPPDPAHGRQHAAGGVAAADPEYGAFPLEVDFDATGSTDADTGDTLTYEWDLNGDGDYDDPVDSTSATPTHTYNSAADRERSPSRERRQSRRPTPTRSASTPATSPPAPQITSPAPGTTWTVGQQLNFHGVATDPTRERCRQPAQMGRHAQPLRARRRLPRPSPDDS